MKFWKRLCGFWGAPIVGFGVQWGYLARLSLQTHYHLKDNLIWVTCAKFEFQPTLSWPFTAKIVIVGFGVHIKKVRQLQHHKKNQPCNFIWWNSPGRTSFRLKFSRNWWKESNNQYPWNCSMLYFLWVLGNITYKFHSISWLLK